MISSVESEMFIISPIVKEDIAAIVRIYAESLFTDNWIIEEQGMVFPTMPFLFSEGRCA